MDKILLKNKQHNYAVGITMSSNRIKRYESLNNENTHGWYTGDGMVFVYNDDANQFNDNYWATVDPQKLPGTTETNAPQKIGSGTTTSSKSFVGASTFGNIGALGNVGSVAMDFVNNDNNLTAHKSWFLMKNGVTALGSNIQNTSSYKAFTYIDNRKLNDSSNYKVYVNGGLIQTPLNKINELKNVRSIYLESNVPGESIGYKFIIPQDLNLGLVERKGSWSEINKAQSRNEYLRKYLEIFVEHTSKNNRYNYVTYPNINLIDFNKINTPTIIKNNDDVQALKFGNNIGVNVFNDTNETIEDMNFSTPLSLTRINNGNQIIFGLSDPSQNSKNESSFKLKDNGFKVMDKSQGIQVRLVNGYWNISLTENGHDGNTQVLTLRK
ncbi:polysaccharide lyase family 8 super-sandwich domain-containing protein [Companilactobacillus pabuli]